MGGGQDRGDPVREDGGMQDRGLVLVVDAANVVGSRPDGWWRDRAGAARALLDRLDRLPGRDVLGADGARTRVEVVHVVLEGRARQALDRDQEATGALTPGPGDSGGIDVVLAPAVGDDTLVEVVERLLAAPQPGGRVVLVTADRGLRARVAVPSWGPGWLRALLDDVVG